MAPVGFRQPGDSALTFLLLSGSELLDLLETGLDICSVSFEKSAWEHTNLLEVGLDSLDFV